MSNAELIAEARDYAHKGKLPAPAHALILGLADALEEKEPTVSEAVKFLKTTPAVTLAGRGGAYELLKEWMKDR